MNLLLKFFVYCKLIFAYLIGSVIGVGQISIGKDRVLEHR